MEQIGQESDQEMENDDNADPIIDRRRPTATLTFSVFRVVGRREVIGVNETEVHFESRSLTGFRLRTDEISRNMSCRIGRNFALGQIQYKVVDGESKYCHNWMFEEELNDCEDLIEAFVLQQKKELEEVVRDCEHQAQQIQARAIELQKNRAAQVEEEETEEDSDEEAEPELIDRISVEINGELDEDNPDVAMIEDEENQDEEDEGEGDDELSTHLPSSTADIQREKELEKAKAAARKKEVDEEKQREEELAKQEQKWRERIGTRYSKVDPQWKKVIAKLNSQDEIAIASGEEEIHREDSDDTESALLEDPTGGELSDDSVESVEVEEREAIEGQSVEGDRGVEEDIVDEEMSDVVEHNDDDEETNAEARKKEEEEQQARDEELAGESREWRAELINRFPWWAARFNVVADDGDDGSEGGSEERGQWMHRDERGNIIMGPAGILQSDDENETFGDYDAETSCLAAPTNAQLWEYAFVVFCAIERKKAGRRKKTLTDDDIRQMFDSDYNEQIFYFGVAKRLCEYRAQVILARRAKELSEDGVEPDEEAGRKAIESRRNGEVGEDEELDENEDDDDEEASAAARKKKEEDQQIIDEELAGESREWCEQMIARFPRRAQQFNVVVDEEDGSGGSEAKSPWRYRDERGNIILAPEGRRPRIDEDHTFGDYDTETAYLATPTNTQLWKHAFQSFCVHERENLGERKDASTFDPTDYIRQMYVNNYQERIFYFGVAKRHWEYRAQVILSRRARELLDANVGPAEQAERVESRRNGDEKGGSEDVVEDEVELESHQSDRAHGDNREITPMTIESMELIDHNYIARPAPIPESVSANGTVPKESMASMEAIEPMVPINANGTVPIQQQPGPIETIHVESISSPPEKTAAIVRQAGESSRKKRRERFNSEESATEEMRSPSKKLKQSLSDFPSEVKSASLQAGSSEQIESPPLESRQSLLSFTTLITQQIQSYPKMETTPKSTNLAETAVESSIQPNMMNSSQSIIPTEMDSQQARPSNRMDGPESVDTAKIVEANLLSIKEKERKRLAELAKRQINDSISQQAGTSGVLGKPSSRGCRKETKTISKKSAPIRKKETTSKRINPTDNETVDESGQRPKKAKQSQRASSKVTISPQVGPSGQIESPPLKSLPLRRGKSLQSHRTPNHSILLLHHRENRVESAEGEIRLPSNMASPSTRGVLNEIKSQQAVPVQKMEKKLTRINPADNEKEEESKRRLEMTKTSERVDILGSILQQMDESNSVIEETERSNADEISANERRPHTGITSHQFPTEMISQHAGTSGVVPAQQLTPADEIEVKRLLRLIQEEIVERATEDPLNDLQTPPQSEDVLEKIAVKYYMDDTREEERRESRIPQSHSDLVRSFFKKWATDDTFRLCMILRAQSEYVKRLPHIIELRKKMMKTEQDQAGECSTSLQTRVTPSDDSPLQTVPSEGVLERPLSSRSLVGEAAEQFQQRIGLSPEEVGRNYEARHYRYLRDPNDNDLEELAMELYRKDVRRREERNHFKTSMSLSDDEIKSIFCRNRSFCPGFKDEWLSRAQEEWARLRELRTREKAMREEAARAQCSTSADRAECSTSMDRDECSTNAQSVVPSHDLLG